ncbi:rhomboid family intramembrane serine protease, partial [Candidatus Aenigmatarchaeota archaeon]
IIAVLLFFLPFFTSIDIQTYYSDYGFSYSTFFQQPWTLVTSVFLHGSLEHLLSNILFWFFFGMAVESELGKKKYLLVFFLGAFMGNFLGLFFYAPETLFIGASAGIFALVGVGMLVRPLDVSFYPLIIPIPLALLGLAYIIFNVYAFIVAPADNISYIGHIGGVMVGFLFGLHRSGWKKSMKIILITLAVLIAIPLVLILFL